MPREFAAMAIDGALDPREPYPPDLSARMHAARIRPAGDRAYWQSPGFVPDRAAEHRATEIARLHRAERIHGPTTAGQALWNLEYDARHDPLMPPWLHRPWYIPSEVMLALDALLERDFGTGYTALGTGRDAEQAFHTTPERHRLWMMVLPVPGMIHRGEDRRAIEELMPIRLASIGIPQSRVTLWNDTEPAKAYNGMLTGSVIREGHVRLGIPREYPREQDYDNW